MSRRDRRLLGLGVLGPILITVFSQLEVAQDSTCVIVGDLSCPFLADVIAPAWALAIIPVATWLRRLVPVYGRPPHNTEGWFLSHFATQTWVCRTTWMATAGSGLIVIFAWTREWERFGQQPEATAFVLLIVATLALLLVPVWWMRDALHERGVRYMTLGGWPRRADAYLYDESEERPPRWPNVLAFAAITMVASLTILGQFDALLRGMNLPEAPSVGMGSLSSIFEFDLSKKPEQVIERVATWREYNAAVGDQFGSAYDIVTAHAIVDTIATIPSYVAMGISLVLFAWRRGATMHSRQTRRTFELITLAALFVILSTAAFDVLKNFLSWYVMDRAWNDPAGLTNANVRLLWFFSFFRTVGLALIAITSLLVLALSDTKLWRLRPALIAVRSEMLLLGFFAVVVWMFPQTADVIRGWRVSHTVITVGLAVVLSMLIRWTSATNLRLQNREWLAAESGDPPEPSRLRIPVIGATPSLGMFVAGSTIALAAVQVLVSVAFDLPVGRGLMVPALLLVTLWVFGLALPDARYIRGDREVARTVRRRLPRLLGAAVYLIVGISVLKAAAASVAYARHEDWYLFFALVPPAVGIWRIRTRTTHTMGRIEAVFSVVLVLIAIVLLSAGNPELSPAALFFTGVTFTYGALAFANSYERTSWPNRVSETYLSPSWARPFVALAAIAMAVAIIWFYVDPIDFAPRVGTIGIILMSMMLLSLIGAGAVRFAELSKPPRILSAFGIRRTPVVVLTFIWLLFAPAAVDRTVNDIRVIEVARSDRAAAGASFGGVWDRWTDRNLAVAPPNQAEQGREVVPLLLVSSSGGGLRAAVWTSYVLDCIFNGAPGEDGVCSGSRSEGDRPLETVAVMSGVSGGALGFSTFLAHEVEPLPGEDGSNEWVEEILGDDYLAAPIGWLFFVDGPRSLIGFGAGIANRSEVMERAWEASWPAGTTGLARGLGDLWENHPDLPPPVYNGSSVNDGCRFNLSVFNAAGATPEVVSCTGPEPSMDAASGGGILPATHDLVDFLCEGDDVRLSTAAGVASRFPMVSVSARIIGDPGRACEGVRDDPVYVVDGGYLEGSGASTLLDAWEALAVPVEAHNGDPGGACVVPFMLHIDNGYESPGVSGNEAAPREFIVPLKAAFSAQSGRITAAREEAALTFEQPFTVGGTPVDLVERTASGDTLIASRYTRIVTRAHPGVEAPLGWTLSQASIDDLRDQLDIEENARAISEVRTWLDGDLRCLEG